MKSPVQFLFDALIAASIVSASICSASTCSADDPQTGQLKIRFEYDGVAPLQNPVPNLGQCGFANVVEEKLIVDPKNKGIKNVVVYLYTGRGGSEIAKSDPPKNVIKLNNENCRFEPHILVR